jgi:hypothetical protein
VQLTANALHVPKAAQIRFQVEIPDNGFLPGALGLDAEMGFTVGVKGELDEVRFGFFAAFSRSALA